MIKLGSNLELKAVLSPTPERVMRLGELEALRGFLSWWVVFGHILWASGITHEMLPRLVRVIGRGDYAVDVFIILSGFLITKLLAEKQERYSIFIVRRFMRLFPAYAGLILIAILLRPLIGLVISSGLSQASMDLANSHDSASFDSESHHFWAHIVAHLTMLHGAIPETLLPYSAVGFLGQAWSISLEWQYYIVAPLLALISRRFGPLGWFALFVCSVIIPLRFGSVMYMVFPMHSFLPQKLLLFLVGGICYWIYVEVAGEHRDLPWRIFFFVAPAILWFTQSFPLAIWTATFALLLADHEARGIAQTKTFANQPCLRRLGEISYSTYLVHYSCISLVKSCILRIAPTISGTGMCIGLLIVAVPLTFAASEALFLFLERPGIRLGRRLTSG